jgi:hypothetical protein
MKVVPVHLALSWEGKSRVETHPIFWNPGPFVVQFCVLKGHINPFTGRGGFVRVQGWRLPDFFLISLSDERPFIGCVELSHNFEPGNSHRASLELDRADGHRKFCPVCKFPLCYTVAFVSQGVIIKTHQIGRSSPTFVSIRVLPDARLRKTGLPLTEILSACVQSARFEVDMNREGNSVRFPRELWYPTNPTDAVLQARRNPRLSRIKRDALWGMTGIKWRLDHAPTARWKYRY